MAAPLVPTAPQNAPHCPTPPYGAVLEERCPFAGQRSVRVVCDGSTKLILTGEDEWLDAELVRSLEDALARHQRRVLLHLLR